MWKPDLTRADVTPKSAFLNRRQILAGGAAAMAMSPGALQASEELEPTELKLIRTYNNFYEFGTGKDDPAKYAHMLTTSPWSITVDGLVDNPGTYDIAELIGDIPTEERIYRFRCVEAWSMVIPWNGFELNKLLAKIGVQDTARYIRFETLVRPQEMPGQQRGIIEWPYREGLRLDEAMHPLTLIATGIYGEPMANQNGAPLRLVVPWKYGFKSIKSIVRISLVADEPQTTWVMQNAREYGFYANVNPNVSHPRWSQASERVIGGGFFAGRIDTLMFNGYEDQVASLYEGMDLAEHF